MRLLDNLKNLIGMTGSDGKVILQTKCFGFNCGEIFVVKIKNPAADFPDKPICPKCEARFNEGIVNYVHMHSGRTTGNFHLIDGWSKE